MSNKSTSIDVFRYAFQANPAAIAILKPQGTFIDVNESFLRITGYTKEELVGHSPKEFNFISPDVRDMLNRATRERKSVRDIEITVHMKTGEMRNVLVSRELIDVDGETLVLNMFYDITMRKRTEDALRESERRFREVLENLNLMVFSLDTDGRINFCNDYTLKLTGWRKEEVIGRDWFDVFVPPERRALLKRVFIENVSSGNIHSHFDGEILTRNGGRCLILWNNTVIRDSQGKVIGTTSIGEDVTELRSKDRELEMTLGRLRAVFDAPVSVALVITDPAFVDPRIIDFSRGAENLFGYTRDEAIGKAAAILHTPEDAARFPEIQQSIREKKVGFTGEMTLVRKSGEKFPAFFTAQPIFDADGEVSAAIRLSIDITDLKRIEDQLRSSMEHFSAIVNSTRSMMVELDADGRVLFANTHAARAFGTQGTLKGLHVSKVFPHEFAEEVRTNVLNVFTNGLTMQYASVLQLGVSRKDVLMMFVPIYGRDGRVSTVMLTVRDISEIKRAEMLHLENLALEEASRLKSEFLASMSHELRTPLNAVLGYTELLQDQVYGELNDRQLRQLGTIYASANALLMLINDILDLSRIEAGKLPLNFEELRVKDLVEDVRAACAPIADKKGQLLEVDLEPDLAAWADAFRVKQCLNNLVSNAIKFTPDGGRIRIGARGTDGLAEISVKDNGIGISRDKLDVIFQPFYRVDSSSTAQEGGAGLGLAITKRLVELMGGRLWLESEPGKGSTFYFTLPFPPIKPDADRNTGLGPEAPAG